MHHIYLSYQPSVSALEAERGEMVRWCEGRGITDFVLIEERLTSGRISQSQLTKLLSPVLCGDTVVASSLSRMGCSINMLPGKVSIRRNAVSLPSAGFRMILKFAEQLASLLEGGRLRFLQLCKIFKLYI